MFDFLVVYLVIICMIVAFVIPFFLWGMRLLHATQKRLPWSIFWRMVFIPFSIGYHHWKTDDKALKNRYETWLNISLILSLMALIYLLVSAR